MILFAFYIYILIYRIVLHVFNNSTLATLVLNLPKFAGGLAPFRGWPSFQEEFFPLVPPPLWLQPQPLEGHAAAQVIQSQTRISNHCLSSQKRLFISRYLGDLPTIS